MNREADGTEPGAFLLRHSVEVASGLLLIVGGVVLTAIGSGQKHSTATQILGGVMTAIGGVLLSWVAATFVNQSDAHRRVQVAVDEIFAHLDAVRRGLGQAAGEINRTVSQVQQGVLDGRVALPLISQATSAIVGQVNEIGVMRGSVLDPADLVETYEVVADIAERLDELSRTPRAPDASELTEVASLLRSLIQQPTDGAPLVRTIVDTDVQCPACGAKNVVRLGNVPGDSAALACTACSSPFNAHRHVSGTAFTRQADAAPRIRTDVSPSGRVTSEESIACPACGYTNIALLGTSSGETAQVSCRRCTEFFNVHRAADGTTFTRASKRRRTIPCPACQHALQVWWPPTEVYCPGCHGHLRQDGNSDELQFVREMKVQTATEVDYSGDRPVVQCPSCGRTHRAVLDDGANHVALCFESETAILVKKDEYEDGPSRIAPNANGIMDQPVAGAAPPSGGVP